MNLLIKMSPFSFSLSQLTSPSTDRTRNVIVAGTLSNHEAKCGSAHSVAMPLTKNASNAHESTPVLPMTQS